MNHQVTSFNKLYFLKILKSLFLFDREIRTDTILFKFFVKLQKFRTQTLQYFYGYFKMKCAFSEIQSRRTLTQTEIN